MRTKLTSLFYLLILLNISGCHYFSDLLEEVKPAMPQVKPFASGLIAPLGLETDEKGRLWVTEAGSGTTDDGTLSMITPQGNVYRVIEGFPSEVSPEGAVFGLNHLLLKDGVLWMLHGTEGKLYKFNVASYTPGDSPLQAKNIPFEDIGTFVKAYPFEEDTDETDVFNLTVGPKGDFYIVDAAANAIIKRDAVTAALSVFATLPPIHDPANQTNVEAVPTGIVFDGHQFLVCTFTGFPFPEGKATIYQVDLHGNVRTFQSGLNTLTDIELGADRQPLVLEYGNFTGESFELNSGRLVRSTKGNNKAILTGLNFPNSIERSGTRTYYVAYTIDGKIEKVVY